MATILILNDDLGFALWLGQALSASSCEALPATTVAEAAALIGHFKVIVDLVILNPRVPGAVDFTRALRREQGRLHVATLDSETADSGPRAFGLPFLACEI